MGGAHVYAHRVNVHGGMLALRTIEFRQEYNFLINKTM
jgi:hypothetical protein